MKELETAAPTAAAGTAAFGDSSTHPDAVDTMPSLSAGISPGPVHPYTSSSQHGKQQQQQQQEVEDEEEVVVVKAAGDRDRTLPLAETQQPAVQPFTEQAAAAGLGLGTEQQRGEEEGGGDMELPPLEVVVDTQQPPTEQPAATDLGVAPDAGTAAGNTAGTSSGTEGETGVTFKPASASPYIQPPSSSTAPGPNHPIMGAAALTGWDSAEGSAAASLPAAATAATSSNGISATAATAATAATGSSGLLVDDRIVLGPAGRSQLTYDSEVGSSEASLPAAATAATAATGSSSDIVNDIAIGGSSSSSGIKAFPPQSAYNSDPSTSSSSASGSSSGIKAFPPQLLPAVGTDPGLGPEQLQVLSVWYSKFCSETEAQLHAGLDQGCAEGMIFEDNFIKVC
jgi:hypothetical protein